MLTDQTKPRAARIVFLAACRDGEEGMKVYTYLHMDPEDHRERDSVLNLFRGGFDRFSLPRR